MRNVIRNILTNWRNVLGKSLNPFPEFTGFPYSFVITPQIGTSVTFGYVSSSHLVITTYTYTQQGQPETSQTDYSYDGFSDTINGLEIGSTFTINSASSPRNLVINGVTIFSNI